MPLQFAKVRTLIVNIATPSLILFLAGLTYAQSPQAPNPVQQLAGSQADQAVPIFRVTVVSRTTKAINYHHRSGATNIGFRGTELLPEARGEARVESRQGVIKIDASMDKLEPARRFGPEYLTYVMWAITPEGRATNIGEVLLNGRHSKLNATTELQAFGLIVTAEPYFAVTQPSDVVVMENFIRHDTTGTIENVDAKFELLRRGQYTLNAGAEMRTQPEPKSKEPIELLEARNAVRIARWAGAGQYAPDTFQKALIGLQNAEGYLIGKGGSKPIGTVAREAVQMAEDARIITVRKREDEQLANERAASANREAKAKAEADEQARIAQMEAQRRAQADAERQAAEVAKADALRTRQEALLAAEQAVKLKAEAEAARAAAIAEQQAARADAAKARAESEESLRLRQSAEQDREQMRAQLLVQLNKVLETRDSARGLIVNMSDVLFDTGQHTLRQGAREKLAKVSGILLAHPGLRLEVEGHTDSVGGEEYNQTLSEKRALSTREYLVSQGVTEEAITSRGFGKTRPVTTNATAEGRQRNRRVELVVSGDLIGSQLRLPKE